MRVNFFTDLLSALIKKISGCNGGTAEVKPSHELGKSDSRRRRGTGHGKSPTDQGSSPAPPPMNKDVRQLFHRHGQVDKITVLFKIDY